MRKPALPMKPGAGRRALSLTTLLLLPGLALALTACSPDPGPRLPNILLITLDTVRADHLGCYGYKRNTSPAMDAFAREALFYEKAYSPSSWTVPSHASLFTGKYPFQHGAHTFKTRTWGNNVNALADEHLTLAEVLKKAGYRTGAVVANDGYLAPRWKLDQGFDSYQVEPVRAPALNDHVFQWLDDQEDGPFFLFINYMDAHRPYNTRPRPGLLPKPAVQDKGQLLDQLCLAVLPGEDPVPMGLARQVINQYDTAIANLDEGVGQLLDHLREVDLYHNTLIILTSDHGEFFGEHHLVEHSKDVFEEALWVPLLVKAPGPAVPRREKAPVSLADVPRIIFSTLTLPVNPTDLAGLEAEGKPRPLLAENYYSRDKDLFGFPWGKRFHRIRIGIYDWPYKYIRSSDGRHELYHLEEDLGEGDNRLARNPEEGERLSKALRQYFGFKSRPRKIIDQAPFTDEELKRLKALGYVAD